MLTMVWIKYLPTSEQRHEDAEQTVCNAPQCSTMAMSPCAQRCVVRATRWIFLRAGARPVVARIAQPHITGIAHGDRAASPTLFRDRRDAHGGAQYVIRSIDQRLRGLSEHPGGDARPDSWHGADNGDVSMLALVPRRYSLRLEGIEQPLEVALGVAALRRDEVHTRQQQLHVRGDGLHHTRCGIDTGVLQHFMDLPRLEPADAVRAQQPFQTALRQRSEEHTSELQSLAYLVCRLLLEKK